MESGSGVWLVGSSLSLLFRAFLGGVFVASGAAKLRQGSAFRDFLKAWSPSSGVLGSIIRVGLPPLELALGGSLLLGFELRKSAWLALGLLLAFVIPIVSLVRANAAVPCGCFGNSAEKPVSMQTVLRNLCLVLITLPLVVLPGSVIGVGRIPRWHFPSGVLMLAAIEATLAVIALVLFAGLWLRKRSLPTPPQTTPSIGPVWHGSYTIPVTPSEGSYP